MRTFKMNVHHYTAYFINMEPNLSNTDFNGPNL